MKIGVYRVYSESQETHNEGVHVKRTLLAVMLSGALILGFITSPPANAVVSAPVTKVITVIEENHSLNQMQAGMPYTFSLAKQYGYATNYTAIRHPSLPNYLAIAGGDTFGVTNDGAPKSHPIKGQSVFGQAIAAGRTARVYMESMPSNCAVASSGLYKVKHNPWPYFVDERTACSGGDVPITRLQADITAGTLPNVGMIVPNQNNDAHDGSLATADAWFKGWMQKIFAGPDWQSGKLAIVLTADEDNGSQGNKVLTVVIHPSQSGKVVTTALTHYSLTRLYDSVAHAAYLRKAATAPSMSAAFALPIG
jgi:hypothetical protein